MRLQTDLVDLFEAAVLEDLESFENRLIWDPRPAVCVVLASRGYPGAYDKGFVIDGLEEAAALADVQVFHAGTRLEKGFVVTDGGRVLGVTALGDTLADAQKKAYQAVGCIRFTGMHYRRDIAARGMR